MKRKILISLGLVSSLLYAQNIKVTNNWKLVGASGNINPASFDGKCVDFVWKYDGKWEVYIPNGKNYKLPVNITKFKTINKEEAFWIKGHGNCDINTTSDCNSSGNEGSIGFNPYNFNLYNYTKTANLTQELKDSLSHMGNEERLAYDVYMNLYNYHKENNGLEINQLYNIAQRSESKHISTVQAVVKRYNLNISDFTNVDANIVNEYNISSSNMPSGVYDIPAIQNLYDALYEKGINSQKDALEVGCMVEVTDINDLDEYITQAEKSNATDIKEAFEFLRSGSYNHYWAFDRGLKNIGISEGCCSLGTIDGVNYCHPEYPKNENSQGYGNSQSHSNNRGNGNNQGYGKGNGNGQDQGNGQSYGNSQGQGNGNGQGHGNGQGNRNGHGRNR